MLSIFLKMNEEFRSKAIAIMENLINHPIHKFTIPDSDNFQEILKKLKKNHYNDLQDWYNDIENVWSSAERFFEQNQQFEFLTAVSYQRSLFIKQRKQIDLCFFDSWKKEVYRLRTKFSDLLTTPPPKVRQEASSIIPSHVVKQNTPALTEKQVHQFVQAAEMLKNEEDQLAMIKIIDELQPEIDNGTMEIRLDVNKLNLNTIYTLREYMREALERHGQKYPE